MSCKSELRFQGYKHWTKIEESYLERYIEILPVPVIAAKLRRSILSVETKAGRMGYSLTPKLNYFSARFLAMNAGIPASTLQLWLNQGFIEAEKESPGKWAIQITEFKRFIKKYPERAQRINPDFLNWIANELW